MIRLCPCCSRDLEVIFDWDDDEDNDGPSVRLEPAPLKDQPCVELAPPVIMQPNPWTIYELTIRGEPTCCTALGSRSLACNWLGNEPTHDTPATRVQDEPHIPYYYRGTETPCV